MRGPDVPGGRRPPSACGGSAVVIGGGAWPACSLPRPWRGMADRARAGAGSAAGRAAAPGGVPQDRQAHILLHRGMVAIESLLPGFRGALLARDAVPFDTGSMPWLGEYGWLATGLHGWEIVSATRPLMDAVTRKLIRAVPGVTVHPETRVTDLRVGAEGWVISSQPTGPGDAVTRCPPTSWWMPRDAARGSIDGCRAGEERRRRSRCPGGLRRPSLPAGRPRPGAVRGDGVRSRRGRRLGTRPAGGGRTVDDLRDRARRPRPPSDPAGFEHFLDALRDPAITDLVACLEPVTDVAVHRQTANRRRGWGLRGRLARPGCSSSVTRCAPSTRSTVRASPSPLSRRRPWPLLAADRAIDHRLQRRLRAITDPPGPSRPATTSVSRRRPFGRRSATSGGPLDGTGWPASRPPATRVPPPASRASTT